MIAIPTTAGTGSETTGVAIFDLLEMHARTGIAHRALRPVMGIVDPGNTRTLPRMVAACTGLDVMRHGRGRSIREPKAHTRCFGCLPDRQQALDFEPYLKTPSGRAFVKKRL